MSKIRVKMADLNVGQNSDVLITSGLGSCVGVAVYDSRAQIGGLAHVMLPEVPSNRENNNPAKYADTALELLLKKLKDKGARSRKLVAKIAGGAQMFKSQVKSNLMNIGERNVESSEKILKNLGIKITGMETGGNVGRTLILDTLDRKVYVRITGSNIYEI